MLSGLAIAFIDSAPAARAETVSNVTLTVNEPFVPTYRVVRYQITGSTVLDQATVDRVTSGAVGDAVSIAHLRRGLQKIQQAYRDYGYPKAAVVLPRQPLTNGVVLVQVADGPASFPKPDGGVKIPAADPNLPTWTVPTFDIQHFEVRGNVSLPPETIDQILSPAAGLAVNQNQLQKALDQLQATYRERGYPNATVSLPQQLLLPNGTITIEISEGLSRQQIADQLAAAAAVETNVVAKAPERTFEVRRYEVFGNKLLAPETIAAAFTNATGSAVSLKQIQTALGELQQAYRERGFASVAVGLPPQQLTNATVKVQVTEGVVTTVTVTGNHFFSSNNIVRTLPSLRTNAVLNSKVFQRELDLANQNRDRQIYPVIGPGFDPGTSELTLKVKDRLPLHGRLEANNYSTPGTPDWRINSSANYNNLWQLEHQAGVSYGFTPEAFKAGGLVDDYLLNRPLIANGGVYYRLPFGGAQSVGDAITANPGSFGYDEATHQFRLPPAGARPDLTVFASSSSSSTGVKYGPEEIVAQTPLLTIVSQDSGQDLTINDGAGWRLNVPFTLDDNRRFNLSGGLDWKHFLSKSFNTNNFIITTVVTNASGSQTITSQIASPQPTRRNELHYFPLAAGLDYFQADKSGTFSASLGASYNFIGDADEFSQLASSTNGTAHFGKITLSLTRDQKLFQNWSLFLRLGGQWATAPLISNEQFALGGLNSVRGYYEGDEYGDSGWAGSAEFRTPYLNTLVPVWSGSVPVWLRGAAFIDGGQRYYFESTGHDAYPSLLGAGFALSANINNHFDLRITLGWPLLGSANTTKGEPRAYFSLGGQF